MQDNWRPEHGCSMSLKEKHVVAERASARYTPDPIGWLCHIKCLKADVPNSLRCPPARRCPRRSISVSAAAVDKRPPGAVGVPCACEATSGGGDWPATRSPASPLSGPVRPARRSSGYTAKASATTQPTTLALRARISQRFGSRRLKAMIGGSANTASTISQTPATTSMSKSSGFMRRFGAT